MNIREHFEQIEKKTISYFGCLSSKSRGRYIKEPSCDVRTSFQVDKDRIVCSNAFRRLKHKTQVFFNPTRDEYRTRLTHTLEVAQIARTIARAMFVNEDLTEAIALGHDLGHTPFGHGGEAILQEIYSINFSHDKQGLRIVNNIENNGMGLNLTYEVLDGILKHSKGCGEIIPISPSKSACTVEGRIVRVSDVMAYVNHDLDDAIRSEVICKEDIPKFCLEVIGTTYQQRASSMMIDIIKHSKVKNGEIFLNLSYDMLKAMNVLRDFLHKKVYRSEQVHDEFIKAKKILSELYAYFLDNEKKLCLEMEKIGINKYLNNKVAHKQAACDFIATITDRHALNLYKELFLPISTV